MPGPARENRRRLVTSGSVRERRDGVPPDMGPVAAAKDERLPHDTDTLRDQSPVWPALPHCEIFVPCQGFPELKLPSAMAFWCYGFLVGAGGPGTTGPGSVLRGGAATGPLVRVSVPAVSATAVTTPSGAKQ